MASALSSSFSSLVHIPKTSNVTRRTLTSAVSCEYKRSSVFGSSFRVQSPAAVSVKHTFRSGSARAGMTTFHDFTVEDISGKEVSLGEYKGKVALVVNVASACGLTNGNYTELTSLYEKYKEKGFVVLAFPSNQFGGQEPGSNEQIKEFACNRYKATFPLFSKVDVNGPNTAPVYKFLKSEKGSFLGNDIKWNFGKFLVDKEGKVVGRYAPTTSPSAIEKDITKLL